MKRKGYEVVIVNNNPETVSTDFDTADRLYFEPLTNEDVMSIIKTEEPYGVVVAFGGQTAIKLTKMLKEKNIKILGTQAEYIDMAEDREKFDELLERLQIKRPKGFTIMTKEEAIKVANEIGYPTLLRPSYVLGGQNMTVCYSDADVIEYMDVILAQKIENPVLIDKYLMGTEIEVDAICDGEDILIPGVMQHIERTGVHSGDSIAVYPSWNIGDEMLARIEECSKQLAVNLSYGRSCKHTVPYLRQRTLRDRSQSQKFAYDTLYKQGHGRADGRSRNESNSRGETCGYGLRHWYISQFALRGG